MGHPVLRRITGDYFLLPSLPNSVQRPVHHGRLIQTSFNPPPTESAHFNPPPTTPPRQSLHLYSSAPPRQPISTPLERPLNSHYQRPQLLFTGVHESPTDLCIVTINHPTRTALFNPLQPPHLVVTSNPTQHPTFTNRCPDCGRYIISNLYDVNMFCLIPMSLIIFNNNNNNNNKS